jgi:hypothetical protein
MYDIFDPQLEEKAKALGVKLLQVQRIEKPTHTKNFTMAASVDRSLFKSGVSMLYNLELLDTRRDHLHHRNSGLDTTLAKLCSQHNVLVGINLANLRKKDPVIMGRVMQNIALCRQHKAKMAVFSDAKTEDELPHPSDVQSLLFVLGMSSQQVKETMLALEKEAKSRQ